MDLWDTHCHLFQEYYENLEKILSEANSNGVTHYILGGVDITSNQEIIHFIASHDNCYGVLGIHPEYASNYQTSDLEFLRENLDNFKVLGIGEIGLDYHYTKENKDDQKQLFELQLELAEKYNLPVVIHSREATKDTIDILKKHSVKGVIHSFSGSLETANIYINMGFKLGINGVVTFKNSKLKELLPSIFSHIVLETDSPYLTPHPYRGQQNSPKYVKNIAEFIADELKVSVSQVEKVTNENILVIFDKVSH